MSANSGSYCWHAPKSMSESWPERGSYRKLDQLGSTVRVSIRAWAGARARARIRARARVRARARARARVGARIGAGARTGLHEAESEELGEREP